jgi:hypothetical protein
VKFEALVELIPKAKPLELRAKLFGISMGHIPRSELRLKKRKRPSDTPLLAAGLFICLMSIFSGKEVDGTFLYMLKEEALIVSTASFSSTSQIINTSMSGRYRLMWKPTPSRPIDIHFLISPERNPAWAYLGIG